MADHAALQKAVAHASDFWAGPCQDGIVWTKQHPIVIKNEYKRYQLNPREWEPVFLNYHRPSGNMVWEGLYFIPIAQADLALRISNGFYAEAFPDRYFICSWGDSGVDVDPGSKNGTPHHTGLNDCAHFVSECLRTGGISIPANAINVDSLLGTLRSRADTKTLAYLVDINFARRIIRANLGTELSSGVPSVLQPGDIIAFGNSKNQHIHSSIYLGNEQITHHTVVNHRENQNHQKLDPATQMNQNWEFESNEVHPRVTLVHFSLPGERPDPTSAMIGWWSVLWNGQTFFYHFADDGRVGWMPSDTPPDSSVRPVFPRERIGYWFDEFSDVRIFWTHSGSFEVYKVIRPSRGRKIEGTCNDIPITISR